MTTDPLDDPESRKRLDPGGMLEAVHALPEQCAEAWQATSSLALPAGYSQITKIVILGMGGSAIAGDMFRALLQRESAIPVFNVRQYDLPPFVDERTLVIASSFSGETEEVISAFDQALATPARKLVVTTGGRLLTTARANGIPTFTFRFEGEARAAVGWCLMPLLRVAAILRLMQGVDEDIAEAVRVLGDLRGEIGAGVAAAGNPAKAMARRLHGKLPVIYAAGPLIEVGRRWKTQLNESAKVWSFCEELPEAHHNAIISYALPEVIARGTAVIFLQSADLVHRRVQLRYASTQRLLEEAGVDVLAAESRGRSALAQMLSLVLFGDYASTYVALLHGVDPTPTPVIDQLKVWLAGQA